MALKMINKMLDANGNSLVINGNMLIDPATKKSMAALAAETANLPTAAQISDLISAAVGALKDNGDGSSLPADADSLLKLSNSLGALKVTLETFLTGTDNGGTIDRLTELVAAIQANKDSIDALLVDVLRTTDVINTLTGTATNKPLSAAQGKALKALIDGQGIAIVSSEGDTPIFDSKMTLVLSDYQA